MKCTRCRDRAEIALRAHNASFCRTCFVFWFERRVLRTIEAEEMFSRQERVLVAVSGGKDSLALWKILADAGYRTVGYHLALGIGNYSEKSLAQCQAFAQTAQLPLEVEALADVDLAVPDMIQATRRPACAACGTAKRHYFDKAALRYDCQVLATGHNLDDEAARLLGNVLHWQMDHLVRQKPVSEARHPKFVRKVKPLYLASELETAAYAFFSKIPYVVQECPNARGATQILHKRLLDQLEHESPGSKTAFVGEFLRRAQPLLPEAIATQSETCCTNCGMPSIGQLCSFCAMTSEIARKRAAKRIQETNPE